MAVAERLLSKIVWRKSSSMKNIRSVRRSLLFVLACGPALWGADLSAYRGFQLGMGWTDVPYPIPNLRVENGPAKAHVRIGWLRSVSNIYHAFAVQSFTDELAAGAGRDRHPRPGAVDCRALQQVEPSFTQVARKGFPWLFVRL